MKSCISLKPAYQVPTIFTNVNLKMPPKVTKLKEDSSVSKNQVSGLRKTDTASTAVCHRSPDGRGTLQSCPSLPNLWQFFILTSSSNHLTRVSQRPTEVLNLITCIMLRAQILDINYPGLHPGSAKHYLCDLGRLLKYSLPHTSLL